MRRCLLEHVGPENFDCRLRLPRLPKLFRREAMPNGELEALQAAPENAGMSVRGARDGSCEYRKK